MVFQGKRVGMASDSETLQISPDWYSEWLDGSKPWLSLDAWPEKPEGSNYGYASVAEPGGPPRDQKVSPFVSSSRSEMIEAAISGKAEEVAVPDAPKLIPTLLLRDLTLRFDPVAHRAAVSKAVRKALVFTLFWGGLYVMIPRFASSLPPSFSHPQSRFILLILMAIFGLMPLLQSGAEWIRSLKNVSQDDMRRDYTDTVLFKRWLDKQPYWYLVIPLLLLGVIYFLQTQAGSGINSSMREAALSKSAVGRGEWWRLVTCGLMHGSLMHILFNGMALFSLGKMFTAFVRPVGLLVVVFTLGVLGGSLLSYQFTPALYSVGASSGLLACLGFLMFLSFRFPRSTPLQVKTGLVLSTILIGIIGFIGARYIDNYGHLGGLITGLLLGAILYLPVKKSPWNYKPGVATRASIGLCSLTLVAAAAKIVMEFWPRLPWS